MEILFYVGIPALVLYFWYASIVTKRNKVDEAFAGIDVQLKKRTDLIPNILKIASKMMDHEKKLLEDITKLRTDVLTAAENGQAEDRFKLEGLLESKMSGLMVAVENYPDLKSQETMVEAQRAYADVEEHISAARRSYNAAVGALRNAVQIFPGNLLAPLAGVTEIKPMFEIVEHERRAVNADDFLK